MGPKYRGNIVFLQIPTRVLQLFIIASFLIVCSQGDCNAVPISLSSLNNCVDNTCSFSQQVEISIPLSDNSEACLEFIAPDNIGPSSSVNISVNRAHFLWDSLSTGYTDDPMVTTKNFCGCPGGSTATCSTGNDLVVPNGTVLCKSGVHNSQQCPLNWFGDSGTWSVNVGLKGNNRYKLVQFKQESQKLIELYIYAANKTYSLTYVGSSIALQSNYTPFEFKFVSDTAVPNYTPKFAVFDKNSMSDFYLLEDTDVNGPAEYVPTKLGWLKTNSGTQVSPGLSDQLQVRLEDCTKNKFDIQYPWINTADFLTNRRQQLSQAISPGAFLQDSEWKPDPSNYLSDPDHYIRDYFYLKTGWLLVGSNSQPIFTGIASPTDLQPEGIIPYPSQRLDWMYSGDNNNGWTGFLTQKGYKNTTNYNSDNGAPSNGIYWNCGFNPVFDTNSKGMVNIWICMSSDSTPSNYWYTVCAQTSNSFLCNNQWTINAIRWPDLVPVLISWDGTFKTIEKGQSLSTTSQLTTEMSTGVLNVIVTFKNLKVTFDSTTIKPKINSVIPGDKNVKVNAQSVSVPGTCYIYSTPANIIATQNIALTMSAMDYTFEYYLSNYNGNFSMNIRCYKVNVQSGASVNFNNNINDTNFGNNSGVNNTNNDSGFNFPDIFNDGDDNNSKGWNYSILGLQWYYWIIIILIGIPVIFSLVYITISYSARIWSTIIYKISRISLPSFRKTNKSKFVEMKKMM